MIITRTPVTLTFFDGAVHYGESLEKEGRAMMGATINKFTYVSVNRLSKFFEYRIRLGYSEAELIGSVEEIAHPGVRETLKFKDGHTNLDIHIFADPPAGMGLGSPASFTVGLLNALYGLEGKNIPKQQLAEEAVHIEQRLAKEGTGCSDQFICAFGGLNTIEFQRSGTFVRSVAISREKHEYLNDSLIGFYAGPTRCGGEAAGEQYRTVKERRNDRTAHRSSRIVSEAETIISDESPQEMAKALGSLLHETWSLKKSLNPRTAGSYADEIYSAATGAGAYGGKLTGTDGSAFFFFLTAPENKQKIREALNGLHGSRIQARERRLEDNIQVGRR